MSLCDLCGDRFHPEESHSTLSMKYCHTCCTDPHRDTLRRVYEVVGLSDYNVREIQALQDTNHELRRLLESCVDWITTEQPNITYQPAFLENIDRFLTKGETPHDKQPNT